MTHLVRRTAVPAAAGAAVGRATFVLLLVVAMTLFVVAGCTAPPTRAGAEAEPITLRVLYGNTSSSIGSDVIDAMEQGEASPMTVRNVSETLEPVAMSSTDAEGDALRRLRQGDADMTIVRAGRLALEGATALAVLEAPMVVTNDEQARRISADPLAIAALDALTGTGLTALAIVPGSLRHPFGYGTAVATPADVQGMRVAVRPDLAARATWEALGAVPDGRVGQARSDAARSGELPGIDSSLDQPAAVDLPAVVTSNLALYAKFDVVVIRTQVLDGLGAAGRQQLEDLVGASVTTALDARPAEDLSLAAWCGRPHAAAVSITPDAIAGFHAVLDPVAERLATSGDSRALLARMRALHAGTTDPAGTTCTGGAAPTRADLDLPPVGSQEVLDGTWRTEATVAALRAGGGDAQSIANNRGVWTFRIVGGLATVDQPVGDDCTMRFTVAGERVRLDMAAEGNESCGGLAIGTYSITGDVVHFVWTADVDGNPEFDQALFGSLTRTDP